MPRKIFPLLLSEEEKAEIEKKASAEGLKVSEYLREIALNRKVSLNKRSNIPKINQQLYIELSRLSDIVDQLPKIFNSTLFEEQCSPAELTLLKEIHQYLWELRLKVIGDDWGHH
jgi:hypothetical protein